MGIVREVNNKISNMAQLKNPYMKQGGKKTQQETQCGTYPTTCTCTDTRAYYDTHPYTDKGVGDVVTAFERMQTYVEMCKNSVPPTT
jgi:hypothetical protein